MTEIYIATEDNLSEAVAGQMVDEINPRLTIAVRMGRKGNGYLKQKLHGLNETAHHVPVFLLTDLDRSQCPPMLIESWRNGRVLANEMIFRVAVREIEAWLLADRQSFAHFTNAPINRVPLNPELLDDPKIELLNLIRRYGSRQLRQDVLPARGSRSTVGLGYNQALSQYVRERWSATRAAQNAESLGRACRRLAEIDVG